MAQLDRDWSGRQMDKKPNNIFESVLLSAQWDAAYAMNESSVKINCKCLEVVER